MNNYSLKSESAGHGVYRVFLKNVNTLSRHCVYGVFLKNVNTKHESVDIIVCAEREIIIF